MSEPIITKRFGKTIDILNKRFGRLIVIKFTGKKGTCRLMQCKCNCGNYTITRIYDLLNGDTKSCGCYKKDMIRKTKTTHGMSGTKFYLRWWNLKNRCYNPNFPDYRYYGARGIFMCERWKNSFSDFYNDIIGTYKDGLTLDRINNNGPYSPENCRWATRREQSQNRNYCHQITIAGKTYPLWKWLQIYSIKRSTYGTRHWTYGWPIIKAITTPVRKYKRYI